VFAGPIRAASYLACALVTLSFGLFVIDESRAASKQSTAQVAGDHAAATANPSPAQERARERVHSRARELIDDANDVLVAPVAWAVPAHANRWVARGLPWLLALVLYGFGLGVLARFSRGSG
jgi:hypothetical protein